MKPFWSLHTHSRYSANDAMPAVSDMVARAVLLDYPALGLTDHGTVAGSVQLYKACRKAGIEPGPGQEFYLTPDRENKEQSNYHLTVMAYSEQGYRNLVGLHNMAQRNFFYKPRIDLADLAGLAKEGKLQGLVGSSGCFFGLVTQTLVKQGPAAAQRLVEALAGWFPRFYVELHNHEVTHYDSVDLAAALPPALLKDKEYQRLLKARDGLAAEIDERVAAGNTKNITRLKDLEVLNSGVNKRRKEVIAEVTKAYVPQPLYQDSYLAGELVKIADAAGIPYLIAQDSHYLVPEEQEEHNSLKQLVSFSEDTSEAVFPGGPYCMVDRSFMEPLYPAEVLDRAIDNLTDLAERMFVRLPELEEFKMRVPDVTMGKDPFRVLKDTCHDALKWQCPIGKAETYLARMESEFDVIEASGYADYLLLVADVCEFMRAQGIWFQTRGSASGSLVCWLLGITQIDPVVYDLRMDRFISTDRMKPPDVDLDVEHERRDEVVVYLSRKWSVRQIGSHMRYSIGVDEEAAKNDEDASKGSLVVKYISTAKKHGRVIKEWKEIPHDDQQMLRRLGVRDEERKLIGSAGTHAAGFLVSPDEAAVAQVPLTWIASSKKMVTTFAMKDVEALGFVKIDLLGLRTMTAIKTTCQHIGWEMADYEAIPTNDKAVFARIARGDTSAIFQLDGYAMTKGCRDLQPKNLEDLIAAQALFRPAAIESGATKDFLARRAGKQPVPVQHADIVAECKSTYGVLLYQEQVIGVLRRMGMPADELTDVLAQVKASNGNSIAAKVALEAVKPRIRELATKRGWDEVDIDWLLDALVAYGEYSFNRAHAASYGITAYRQTYLAVHYPVEFWLGIVSAYEETKREVGFVRSAREHKVTVLSPHVNRSGVSYSLDKERNAIRKGLTSVNKVGQVTAHELVKNQPYTSLLDLACRVIPQKVSGVRELGLGTKPHLCGGAVAELDDAGALEGLS